MLTEHPGPVREREAVYPRPSMPSRRILVVTYYYPPDRGVGGNRWAAMTRYLRAAGHEVHVLTTRLTGSLPDDPEQGVVRAWDLQASEAVRRGLGRASLSSAADGKGGAPTGDRPAPRWITQGIVPDATLATWVPAAAREARRLLRRGDFDCIVTSAPPDGVALVPLLLGRRRPAWIADFRDGWRFEPLRGPWPTRPQDALDRRLEAVVVSRADVTIGATEPIAQDFGRRLGARAAYVPNGWDPSLDERLEGAKPVPLDAERFNLVYTGQLSGPAGRDPRPLLEGMQRLVRDRGREAERLRLVLVGGLDARDAALLQELDTHGLVDVAGQRDRDTSIATQRAADALLLLTTPGHVSHATGKLFEYLAARRPILALAEGSAAARIVRDTDSGTVAAADDPGAIAAALGELLDGRWSKPSSRPDQLQRYLYPGPADAMLDLIERAIAHRAAT